jgi:RNA polymerase-binding transcription factor
MKILKPLEVKAIHSAVGHTMKQPDIQRIKRTLESLLENCKQPAQKREEIAIETSPDALDQVQHAGERELAIRQLEFDSSRLRNIRQAIQRIDEGTYGVCLKCDSEISPKRLEAVPWTAYCFQCQSTAESDANRAVKEEYALKAGMKGAA